MNRFIVNVAKNGRHFCRIELPETIEEEAKAKARLLREMFTEHMEGDVTKVEVTMTRWNDVGTETEF